MAKDAKPVTKSTKTVAKETKPAPKQTNSVAKESKPVAKDIKPAVKETKPATKEAKPNIFQRMIAGVRRYFSETIGELRKVSWPTRKEAGYLTLIVLIVTAIMSIILGTADWVFSKLFEFILTLPL